MGGQINLIIAIYNDNNNERAKVGLMVYSMKNVIDKQN